MSADQAPVSSRHVRHALFRHVESGAMVDAMEITTAIVSGNEGEFRALTTISRPRIGENALRQVDQEVARAIKTLAGLAGSYSISMGRTYEVNWSGVRRPI